MKCPICDRDFPKGFRAVHAHMMKDHLEEYRKKGCSLKNFGIDINAPENKPAPKEGKPSQQPKGKPVKKKEPPDDFRPLDRSNADEAAAYAEGCRYYSGGCAYTTEECREMGWI